MEPARRRGAPARVSLDQITEAALAIVEREGFESLTLKKVGLALGVVHSALYRWVPSSEALLELVVERMVAGVIPPAVRADGWRAAAMAVATALRDLLSRHPAYLLAGQRRPLTFKTALRPVDDLIGQLLAAGLSEQEAADAYFTIWSFTVGWVGTRQGRARAAAGAGSSPADGEAEMEQWLRTSDLAALAATSRELSTPFAEGRFERQIELICDGIAGSLEA